MVIQSQPIALVCIIVSLVGYIQNTKVKRLCYNKGPNCINQRGYLRYDSLKQDSPKPLLNSLFKSIKGRVSQPAISITIGRQKNYQNRLIHSRLHQRQL